MTVPLSIEHEWFDECDNDVNHNFSTQSNTYGRFWTSIKTPNEGKHLKEVVYPSSSCSPINAREHLAAY